MKKLLLLFAFCFVVFAFSPTPAWAQPSCTDADTCTQCQRPDRHRETPPCGIVCPKDPNPVLFLYGREFHTCASDLPDLERDCNEGANPGVSWYCPLETFLPSRTILYNGAVFNIPDGGVYVCDTEAVGCADESCRGVSAPVCGGGGDEEPPEEIRGCDDPRVGDKDTGCYGSTLKKDSPDRTQNFLEWILERLVGEIKTFFNWGGDEQIKVDDLYIPIEGDLDKLLGDGSQRGTLPKLTPPGAPSEDLRQNKNSYLEDYSKGILEVSSCKTPGSKNVEFAVPDVWGLKNTAVNLFSYLVRVPGTASGPQASSKEDYQINAANVGRGDFEPRLLGRAETLDCINLSANTTSKPTVQLARTGSVLGEGPPSGCYGQGLCDKIDPDKDVQVCLISDYGLIGSAEDLGQSVEEEGETCSVDFEPEVRTCTPDDVANEVPPSPPCPAGPNVCTVIGPLTCNYQIPSCDKSSTNDLSMPPRVSFLGGPEGYTDNIIETYKIFTIPGMNFKNDLFGEGEFDWDYQNVYRQDEKAMYRKLGTVQCLENHVQQSLSLPGHGLVLDENCFED